MKLSIISILLIACALSSSCCNPDIDYSNIYVLIDVTDQNLKGQYEDLLNRSVPEIEKAIGVRTDHGGYPGASGGKVKTVTINDVSASLPIAEIPLKTGKGPLCQNPVARLKEIKDFEENVKLAFTSALQVPWQKTKSEIYQNVCRELIELKKEKPSDFQKEPSSHKRIMVVLSDLLENSVSTGLNFYTDDIENLTKNIENKYKTNLKPKCELPDLSDIKIFVVTIRTSENNQLINEAENFWKALFHLKNGDVTVGAVLNMQTLKQESQRPTRAQSSSSSWVRNHLPRRLLIYRMKAPQSRFN